MIGSLLLLGLPGRLFLAGGGTTPPAIVEAFFKACGGKDSRVIVLPLANEDPATGKGSEDFLKEAGATNTTLFANAKPTPADLDALKAQLENAKGVWMPGGVQQRFIDRLGKAWIDANLPALLAKGVNFYGTSAGAMVCSRTMITGPGKAPDTAETGLGFGLTSWVVDTHFRQRNRLGRLNHALASTGCPRGVGIDESDWIVIWQDVIVEQHGKPTIIFAR